MPQKLDPRGYTGDRVKGSEMPSMSILKKTKKTTNLLCFELNTVSFSSSSLSDVSDGKSQLLTCVIYCLSSCVGVLNVPLLLGSLKTSHPWTVILI